MSDPIEYEFSHADLPAVAISKRLLSRWRRGNWVTRIGALLGGSAVGGLIAVASAMLNIPFWAALLLALGPTVLYAAATQFYASHTLRGLAAAQGTAPWRAGATAVRIGPNGVALTDGTGTLTLAWPMVTDIVLAEAHLLLMLSPLEYVPIPEGAIAPLTLEEAAARIEEWLRAAATPQESVPES
ncbi:hypothetical protein RDV64_10550 [Acuticoccus sp. MNP-M23]|uniref:hypothetical protein n=1 Tax=Acuticoccus sp. MNP-M23 TaxID=3072793 RepID=UPI002815F7EC|nr:hypothetical protein [Acuticoccus sp. MNP-M23]WMS44786.1 hypothetical protein RDV64_10550 [Acuticoccus sp. MNP-M23]